MGRGVADIHDELKLFPFRIDPSSKNMIRVRLGDKFFTPPEISAFILRELKNWAEAYFGESVDRAVVTVPATSPKPSKPVVTSERRPRGWPRSIDPPGSRYTCLVVSRKSRSKLTPHSFSSSR